MDHYSTTAIAVNPLSAMGRRAGPQGSDARSDEHSHTISSFTLGHKPYMSPRLLCSTPAAAISVSKSSPAFPTDSYLQSTYAAQHSVDIFGDMQADAFDRVRSDELQSFAFPESSQRTLLPETPFGMYDSLSSESMASRFAMQDWREGGEDDGGSQLDFHPSPFIDEDAARHYPAGRVSSRPDSELLLSLYQSCFPHATSEIRSMMGQFTVDATAPQRSTPSTPHTEQLHPVLLTLQLNAQSLEEIQDPEGQSDVARIFNFAEDSDDDEEEEDYFGRWGALDDASYLDTDLASFGSDQAMDRQWSQSSLTLVGSGLTSTDSDQSLGDGSMSPGPSQFDPESPVSSSTLGRSFSGSSLSGLTSASSSQRRSPSKKKSKMHQCGVCKKWFPRPSGLKTHMNSHSGEKPYKCTVPNCNKSFAVRSNAKRHLRTHGIIPTSEPSSRPASKFTVGFETPMVSPTAHEMTKIPNKLKWIPMSLQTRTNIAVLQRESSVEDDDTDEAPSPSPSPILPAPLPAVVPSLSPWNFDDDYEERNSYAEIGTYPYHPSQWRGLPGPAPVPPTGVH